MDDAGGAVAVSPCVAARREACDAVRVLGHLGVRPARWLAAAACVLPAASGCGARSTLDAGEPPPSMRPSSAGAAAITPQGGNPAVPPGKVPPEPVRRPCSSVSLTLDELRPTVTLLVDQSGSMRSRYPTRDSEQTRWQVVRQALLDPTTGVVPSLQQSIQFGLSFYTSHNGFSGGVCPILNEVRSATGNYEAIRSLYDSLYPDDDTPTGAAVQQVTRGIRAAGRQGPEVILLVTDGDPDTCAQPDPQDGQAEAIEAVAAAHASGIDFYVLGVSSDISGDNLQQLANAGQGKAIDSRWGIDADAAQPYQASASVTGLTAQLRDILARVPLCQVALDRDVAVDELSAGNVVLDGQPLSYGTVDGFVLEDSRHLRIQGKACDTLRAAGKRLSVRISCD